MILASINVNGLRAAARNGIHQWLEERAPDVVTLQEVRAPDALVADLLGPGWHVVHVESSAKGRAGVAVASRLPITGSGVGDGIEALAGTGRWVEADIVLGDGSLLTVISCYAHTGDETVPERMTEKLAFFDAIAARLTELRDDGRHVLLTGDLNVAHTDDDVKNWKGNAGCAGCLPEERAHFDRWFSDLGFVDVGRALAGPGPGPYTWW